MKTDKLLIALFVVYTLSSCSSRYEESNFIQSEVDQMIHKTLDEVTALKRRKKDFILMNEEINLIMKAVQEVKPNNRYAADLNALKQMVSQLPSKRQFTSPTGNLAATGNNFMEQAKALNREEEVKIILARYGFDVDYDFFDEIEDARDTEKMDYKAQLKQILLRSYRVSFKLSRTLRSNYYSVNAELADYIIREIEEFEQKKISFINALQSEQTSLSHKQNDVSGDIADKENYVVNLKNELKTITKASIDSILIQWALPIFGGIIVIMMAVPVLYRSSDTQNIIFQNGLLLQLLTVFLLTVTILLLGIGDKIKSEVLGTLLGGISVYVLQQSKSLFKKDEKINDDALNNQKLLG
jgi:hypothetical protein